MKYGKRSKFRKILSSPITLIALVLLFAFLAHTTLTMRAREILSLSRFNQANLELDKLKERQIELQNKVKYLSTDQGIEAEIRTKYSAVKDGESVAVIVDDQNKLPLASVVDATETPQISLWGRLFQMIGF